MTMCCHFIHPSWKTYPTPDNLPPVVINDDSQLLVSIVTPSYNQARFIRATIESVLSQDYPNIEYWVIDGNSTDGTQAILRDYEHDPRFHWVSEPDKGQADAINKGWRWSRGSILAWLNSDDTYLPRAISTQVAALQANTHCGLAYGNAPYIDADGNTMGKNYRTRAFHRTRFLQVSGMPQPTVFLRRWLVEASGTLNIHLQYALDFEFFARSMWNTEFHYTKKPIATYRLYETSKTVEGYKQSVSESVAVAQTLCREHRADTRMNCHRITADWYWAGATQSLDAGNYADVLAYSVVAIRCYPLSPRMLMVGIKLLDSLLHTPFARYAIAVCNMFGI